MVTDAPVAGDAFGAGVVNVIYVYPPLSVIVLLYDTNLP